MSEARRVLLCHRLDLGDLVLASPGLQWFVACNPGVFPEGARILL